jgi:DNA-directed RNA polymerase specialized sigma24 family protein
MTKACLCAGLNFSDAEDVAQDIWAWMLRTGVPIALIATPWLTNVVRNYVLRHRRRRYRQQLREGQPLERAPEPKAWQPEARLESNELLDRVASLLPQREKGLLDLIRRGYSLPEAARLVGIPEGSRDYCQGRVIACARRELARKAVPPTPSLRPAASRPAHESFGRKPAVRTRV